MYDKIPIFFLGMASGCGLINYTLLKYKKEMEVAGILLAGAAFKKP